LRTVTDLQVPAVATIECRRSLPAQAVLNTFLSRVTRLASPRANDPHQKASGPIAAKYLVIRTFSWKACRTLSRAGESNLG